MAYSEQELQDYWASVQDGSVLSNAAPNAFEGSQTFTPDQTEDLQDIRDTSFMDRQAAMDFAQRYDYTPEEAEMLSDRLSGVLASDSPYIQRARTRATEQASGRGLLDSSMAAGAAEGAAIDRGLQVAQGDVDVDKFNIDALNKAGQLEYQAAQDIGGRTQEFQNRLGGAEADYIMDVGLQEQQQEDQLAQMEAEQNFKIALQDSAHADDLEKDMLQYTNSRVIEMLKQESGLYAGFLEAYGTISSADISVSDKNAQLTKLGKQIDNAVAAAADYKNIVITGNAPYFGIRGI